MRATGAVNHLFKVASGIDSMIIGDIQILSQIKDGFNIAYEEGDGKLPPSTAAIGISRRKPRARETTITEGAVSVSYAAVELANKIFSDLSKKSALLIGAGETGELTAKHLVGRGIGSLFVANRTKSKAEELVAALDAERSSSSMRFSKCWPGRYSGLIVGGATVYAYPGDIQRAMKSDRMNHFSLSISDSRETSIPKWEQNQKTSSYHDMDGISRRIDQNMQKRKSEIPAW